MDVPMALKMVMASQVCTHPKLTKLYILNTCGLSYINHNFINQSFKSGTGEEEVSTNLRG